MEPVQTTSSFLSLKFDAVRAVLLFLNGKEALRIIGSSCKLFLNLLIKYNPQQQFLWSQFVQQEFKKGLEYQNHNQLIHNEMNFASDSSNNSTSSLLCWRRAYQKFKMRTNLNSVRWRKLKNDPNSPTPRQGSAGTTLENGDFAIFGGWTTHGMGRSLQVLRCQEDNSLKWSKEVMPPGRDWDQFRPTYGHTLTALPGTTSKGTTCLLVLGGSTQGGYRGVVGFAHRLIVKSNGGKFPELSFKV